MFGKIPAALLGVTFFLLQSQASVASDSDPSWSPDGKKIVFMSNRDGDIEIYVANTDGTGVQRLTYAPGRDAHPVFSRDGKKIAFQSPRAGRQPQIYVMNADGSNQTRLTDSPGFSGVPDWSPDDKQIIFQSNLNPTLEPPHWQVFLVNSDASGLKQITHDDYNDQVPKWSPDGNRIMFFSDKTGRNQLYTMRADGSDWQGLLTDQREDSAGSWSHDGQRILFTADAGHGADIYTFDLRTKQEKQLTTNAPGLGVPFWSPDEKTIAFTMRRGEQSDVYFMNADGSNQRKLFQAHGVTRGRSGSQASLGQEGPRFTTPGALQRLWPTAPRVAAETVVPGGSQRLCRADSLYRPRPHQARHRRLLSYGGRIGMIVGQKNFDSLTISVSGGAFEDRETGVRSSIFKDNDGNLIQFFTNSR